MVGSVLLQLVALRPGSRGQCNTALELHFVLHVHVYVGLSTPPLVFYISVVRHYLSCFNNYRIAGIFRGGLIFAVGQRPRKFNLRIFQNYVLVLKLFVWV